MSTAPAPTAELARRFDDEDPLASYRDAFFIPRKNDRDVAYFCGNSLGLHPKLARTYVEQDMDDWARLAVDAHFGGQTPWYRYHEVFRETAAKLVGARPGEVVMMNSLTVNLHLMMVTFYRPDGPRRKLIMEAPAFPSDTYAIRSHLRSRGVDPDDAIQVVGPRDGEHVVREEDLLDAIAEAGDELALILIGGVNFLTGQVFDLGRLTEAAHAVGAHAGFDLAHGAGNIQLALHDWNVDFACWCSYKYLNASPGAVAGCFVHERHGARTDLPRFGGWWGNDPETRFRMQLESEFNPQPDADGWQLSNPPILAMAPLRASLELFDAIGMPALVAKSRRLTGFLRAGIEAHPHAEFEVITPREDNAHGCQLSILIHDRPRERFETLQTAGILGDFREPNVIRVAPVPLYNSFQDVWRLIEALA